MRIYHLKWSKLGLLCRRAIYYECSGLAAEHGRGSLPFVSVLEAPRPVAGLAIVAAVLAKTLGLACVLSVSVLHVAVDELIRNSSASAGRSLCVTCGAELSRPVAQCVVARVTFLANLRVCFLVLACISVS